VIGGTTGNNFDAFNNSGTSSPAFYQTFASLALFDGVYTTGGSIEKTKVWGFRGGYEHNWSPNWQTSVFGSYTHVDYNANATAIFAPTLLHSTQQAAAAIRISTSGRSVRARHGPRSRT
jgi:hypothetical protein